MRIVQFFRYQRIKELLLIALTVGVTNAAVLQPNFSKIVLPNNIMMNVTAPVADEKFPMNAE